MPAERSAPGVLLVAANLSGGGAERQLVEMANYWIARDRAVAVATWDDAETNDFYRLDSRVRRIRLGTNSRSGSFAVLRSVVARIRALRSELLASGPNVIVSFLTENNVLTLLSATRTRCPVIVSERTHPGHDDTVTPFWRRASRLTYPFATFLTAQTGATARWMRDYYRRDVQVVPNVLRPLDSIEYARENLIVAIGRLVPQKGFDLLLRAFARTTRDFPGWRVAICGDGHERQSLEQLGQELGVNDRVAFLGQVPNVEHWMARAGLVVQPSRFEGFPNAVLEAMATGAPVISADCPSGPSDLISQDVNGVLVPPEDVDALAGAMRRLLLDEQLRLRLGARAREVRERFSADRVMAQWSSFVETAMPRKKIDGK